MRPSLSTSTFQTHHRRRFSSRCFSHAALASLSLMSANILHAQQFERVPDLPSAATYSFGCAWGDYDNDGFMDLFVTASTGLNALYHNLTNTNHWIKFRLKGTRSNASAIGAKVRVQAQIHGTNTWQMREICGGTYAQDDPRPNFGLGTTTAVLGVRVEWPSGAVQEFGPLPIDQIHTVIEPTIAGSLKSDGLFEVRFTGDTLRTYTLEASPDLAAWITVTNFTQGSASHTDHSDSGQQRFYRLK
jgi:hypothetical protein